jgi:hypothetical protein
VSDSWTEASGGTAQSESVMNLAIQKIKEALPLPLLAGEYVKLRRTGKNHLALCLWHSDHQPSLRIYEDHFYCFVCQKHGDIIDFLMQAEGITKAAAFRSLSVRTGIPLDRQAPRTRLQRAYDAEEMQFAEWWFKRQKERLAARLSAYVRLGTEEEADSAGQLWRMFSQSPRSAWRHLALRCATAEDRQQWEQEKLELKEFSTFFLSLANLEPDSSVDEMGVENVALHLGNAVNISSESLGNVA